MQLVEDGRKVYWITPLKRTVLNKSLKANVMGFSTDTISIWWDRTLCLFLVLTTETLRQMGGIYSRTCAYNILDIHVERLSTAHYSPYLKGLVAALVGSFKEILYMMRKWLTKIYCEWLWWRLQGQNVSILVTIFEISSLCCNICACAPSVPYSTQHWRWSLLGKRILILKLNRYRLYSLYTTEGKTYQHCENQELSTAQLNGALAAHCFLHSWFGYVVKEQSHSLHRSAGCF